MIWEFVAIVYVLLVFLSIVIGGYYQTVHTVRASLEVIVISLLWPGMIAILIGKKIRSIKEPS